MKGIFQTLTSWLPPGYTVLCFRLKVNPSALGYREQMTECTIWCNKVDIYVFPGSAMTVDVSLSHYSYGTPYTDKQWSSDGIQ